MDHLRIINNSYDYVNDLYIMSTSFAVIRYVIFKIKCVLALISEYCTRYPFERKTPFINRKQSPHRHRMTQL